MLLVKLPPRVPQDGHKDALTFANSKLRLRSSFQEPPLLLLPEKEAVGEPVSRNLFSAAYASKVSESLLEPTVLLYDGEDGFCLPVCRVVSQIPLRPANN